MFYTSATRLHGNAPQWGRGGRGYSGFQVTGMTEGFLCGFEIFDFGIFLGRKILASIFLEARARTNCCDSQCQARN